MLYICVCFQVLHKPDLFVLPCLATVPMHVCMHACDDINHACVRYNACMHACTYQELSFDGTMVAFNARPISLPSHTLAFLLTYQ